MSKSIWDQWDEEWQGVGLSEAQRLNKENAERCARSDEARRPIVAAFMRQDRWTLLSVLVWIATRSPALASYGENKTISSLQVGMLVAGDKTAKATGKTAKTKDKEKADADAARQGTEWLEKAWTLLVAQAVKHNIAAACDSVDTTGGALAVRVRGQSFPPVGEPKAWLTYAPRLTGDDLVLMPSGLDYGRGDGFANVTFDRTSILSHWPGNPRPFALRAPVGRPSKVPLIIAQMGHWSEAERRQSINKKVEQLTRELGQAIDKRTIKKAIKRIESEL